MPKRIRVWPYKMGSAGARILARTLNIKRVRTVGKYRPRNNDLVINWGNARAPVWPFAERVTLLNFPNAVNVASNKLLAFRAMLQGGVSIPLFDVSKEGLLEKLGKFKPVISRYQLRGTSGQGAVYFETSEGFMESAVAPLYVEYIKKTAEYRVHVFRGQVIDFSEKRKRRGGDQDGKIRNLNNGWVFCRDGVALPEGVAEQAIKAVQVLGLDFGAVDVIYNRVRGVYVLEVNTAPGLQGTTVNSYVKAIRDL